MNGTCLAFQVGQTVSKASVSFAVSCTISSLFHARYLRVSSDVSPRSMRRTTRRFPRISFTWLIFQNLWQSVLSSIDTLCRCLFASCQAGWSYCCGMGKSPFLMGKSPFLMGKSPFLMGKSPFLMGKSPLLWLIYTECSSDSARLQEESELSALSVQLFTIPEASLGCQNVVA